MSEFEEVNSVSVEELTVAAEGNNSNNLLRANPMRDLFGRTLSIMMVDSKGVPLTQWVSSMATALNNSLKADVELDNNSSSVIALGAKSDACSFSSTDGADNIVFGGPTSEESLDSCVDVAIMGTRNAAPRDARTAGVVIIGDVFTCRSTILPKRSFLISRDFVAALQRRRRIPPTRGILLGLILNLRNDGLRRKNVDQGTHFPPLSDVIESFSEDVSTHARRLSVAQRQKFRLESLVQPRNGDPVGPLEVAHRGVTPRFDDRNHRLIVFMKRKGGLVRKQRPPQ